MLPCSFLPTDSHLWCHRTTSKNTGQLLWKSGSTNLVSEFHTWMTSRKSRIPICWLWHLSLRKYLPLKRLGCHTTTSKTSQPPNYKFLCYHQVVPWPQKFGSALDSQVPPRRAPILPTALRFNRTQGQAAVPGWLEGASEHTFPPNSISSPQVPRQTPLASMWSSSLPLLSPGIESIFKLLKIEVIKANYNQCLHINLKLILISQIVIPQIFQKNSL